MGVKRIQTCKYLNCSSAGLNLLTFPVTDSTWAAAAHGVMIALGLWVIGAGPRACEQQNGLWDHGEVPSALCLSGLIWELELTESTVRDSGGIQAAGLFENFLKKGAGHWGNGWKSCRRRLGVQ